MKKVLIAGSTGYLGKFAIKSFKNNGYWIRALARTENKLGEIKDLVDEIFIGDATKPDTLRDICKDIDIVFSSLGITKQNDGLTYMDVDFNANKNILSEAKANNVEKFIYISVLNANKFPHLKMINAKLQFTRELKLSGLNYLIINPNGFFSDMSEFFKMAQKGRIYLFGDGKYLANPIHGEDLANFCVDSINKNNKELDIGGPEVITQLQLVETAFEVLKKEKKVTLLPDLIRKLALITVRTFTSAKTYGPVEFFMTVLAMDMVAPKYGKIKLKEYFKTLIK